MAMKSEIRLEETVVPPSAPLPMQTASLEPIEAPTTSIAKSLALLVRRLVARAGIRAYG